MLCLLFPAFFFYFSCLSSLFLSVGFCFVFVVSGVWVSEHDKRKRCFLCSSGVLGGKVGATPILVKMFC